MKKIFTKFKKTSFGIFALVLFTGSVQATTYTASQTGNWSDANTWGGVGSPGSTVGTIDNVVIPVGMAVTMDMDVAINSLASYINVMGSLISTTNSLTVTQGALQGTGIMNLFYVEIGSLGSLTFSGTLTTGRLVNSGATIAVSSNVIINDTLVLNNGSMAFNAGSTLTMNNSSNIKISAGSMSISGGVLLATNLYDVIYVGNSKTSGVETSISAGAHNVWVNLTDSAQMVTMGSDLTIAGTLYNTMGKVAIGAHTLKLMGDYVATTNGKIQSIATSRLMFESAASVTSTLSLSSAAQFQYLEINIGAASSVNFSTSFSVDTVYMKSGTASFTNASTLTISPAGVIIKENGAFNLGIASFMGTNMYSVIYKGTNKTTAYEILGAGLQNVTINLASLSNSVSLGSNLTVNGLFSMNMGYLYLNGYNVNLNGTFSSTSNSAFSGHVSSTLKINNPAVAFGDTIRFPSTPAMLDSLIIKTMPSTWVTLGSALTVENLTMVSGGLTLINGDLTVNSTGSITGYDSTKYINTGGTGSLVMNVNAAAPYVLFPVGTNLSYSPASLQIVTGTSGSFHVNTQNGMLTSGTSGTNMALTQSVVNRTWFIQEPTQPGTLNANLQVQWKTTEEMNSFDRAHAYISHYTAAVWDASTISAATTVSGTFHSITRTNLSSFSPFAIVDQNALTGIEKTVASNVTVSIYPNPTANYAVIDFKNADAKSVEVYNEIGSKVYSIEITDKTASHKIDMAALPAGIYYVKVATTTSPIIKKLIKS